MHRDIRLALLSRGDFQALLVRVGTEPPAGGKMLWRHSNLASVHKTRTIRAGRIHLVSVALRGLFSGSELDFYASVIKERRRTGAWPRGGAPPGLLGGSYKPSSTPTTKEPAAPALIAKVFARCAQAATNGEPEALDDRDRLRLSRALKFLELTPVPHSNSGSSAAVRKRGQRQRAAMAPVVEAERQYLEAEVAAGRMVKVSEYSYVNSGGPEADAEMLRIMEELNLRLK